MQLGHGLSHVDRQSACSMFVSAFLIYRATDKLNAVDVSEKKDEEDEEEENERECSDVQEERSDGE